jgi:hypothetical protein
MEGGMPPNPLGGIGGICGMGVETGGAIQLDIACRTHSKSILDSNLVPSCSIKQNDSLYRTRQGCIMKRAKLFSFMTLSAAAALFLIAPIHAQQRSIDGRWEGERSRWNGEWQVHINLRANVDGERFRSGFSLDADEIDGDILARRTNGSTPVRFELRRQAGTFLFEGEQDGREAWGSFTWTGSAEFLSLMSRRGYERITVRQHLSMTTFDVTTAFLDRMERRGYDLSISELLSFRIHGIDAEYVDELAAEGFENISTDYLLSLRIHGVSGQYAREMEELGYDDLSLDDLLRGRIHGVSAEHAADMTRLGFSSPTFDGLIRMRIHGVTADLAYELAEAGLGRLSAGELVEMSIHGVTPSFIREMAEVGYEDISPNNLVKMRIHGVDADFVRDLERHGMRDLSVGRLVRVKIRGDWWRL